MKRQLLKIAVTVALCAALYAAADWRAVAEQFTLINVPLLMVAFALFVPQVLTSAWRWRRLVKPLASIGILEGSRQVLVANAANLIVPSRFGDFAKAALLPGLDVAGRKKAAGLIVVEKVFDVSSMVLAFGVGALGPVAVWGVPATGLALCAANYFVHDPRSQRFTALVGGTIVLWSLHFTQLHLFVLCCGVQIDTASSIEKIPAALLAGIFPSFCGIGTRDAAFIWVFSDVAPAATMAAVGVLSALRYIVPGAVGIPLWWAGRRNQTAGEAEPISGAESTAVGPSATPHSSAEPNDTTSNRRRLQGPATRSTSR